MSSLAWIVCSAALHPTLAAESPQSDRHVVVVVWDGMRPDFMSAENTPVLWKLAQEGVNFRNHHAVYPSATEVNGAALATGTYPGRNRIVANYEYRPEIDNKRSIAHENADVVGKGDQLSGGKYLACPTIAELVHQAGRRTVIAAAKGVGLLQDRHGDSAARAIEVNRPYLAAKDSVTLFAGKALPLSALAPIVARLGPSPLSEDASRDNWATRALTDFLWQGDVPIFSLLWLGEPDASEHRSAPGSKEALAAIKSSDENLGRVLAALDRQGVRATTDIFVVSDHGFSTIARAIDLRKILRNAAFDAVTGFTEEPKPGQIMLVGNGGTVLFYVVQQDAAVIGRLVDFLQHSDFAGVIFTKKKLEGTFTLDQGGIDPPSQGYGAAGSEHAPDVVMAFRWNENKNQFGVAGMVDADWNRGAGKGTHASLSRFDLHNTLIAAGPDFQRGHADELPSGNIDLAPTILRILGITPPKPLDGRVLSEAMIGADHDVAGAQSETVQAKKSFSSGMWQQTLRISRVGSTMYLDEGKGEFVAKRAAASPGLP